jgi:hypothetical protein
MAEGQGYNVRCIFHTDTRKMKGLLFFLVLLGVIIVAWNFSTKEGFQDSLVTDPGLNIPLISPRYQTLVKGEIQPFSPPSTSLLAPPPGQSASVNTRPDSDPAMQKATAERIQSIYESVVGFFAKDAAGLQKIGDPSIQLPLTTTRGDRERLKDELDTLKRNPGLESSLTSEDVDGIQANLGYLQKKWRMSTNALSGSPMEGFQSGGTGNGSGNGSGSGSGNSSPGCPPATEIPRYGLTSVNGVSLGPTITVPYVLNGTNCVQQCPTGFTLNIAAGTCEMTMPTGITYIYLSDLKTAPYTDPKGSGSGSGSGPPTISVSGPTSGMVSNTLVYTANVKVGPSVSWSPATGVLWNITDPTGSSTFSPNKSAVLSFIPTMAGTYKFNVYAIDPTFCSSPSNCPTAYMAVVVSGATTTKDTDKGSGSDVTLEDLQDLSMRIGVEIIRLQSSGAADSFVDINLQSRINTLVSIKKAIDDIIAEVKSGARKLKDVPLTKADIAKFLPAMVNRNTALPTLIKDAGASNYLNNLFPTFGAGDISGAILAQKLFNKYEDQLVNNLSWDVSLKYTSSAEQQVAANNAVVAGTYGYMPEDSTSPYTKADEGGYRGFLDSLVHKIGGKGGKGDKGGKHGQGGQGGQSGQSGQDSHTTADDSSTLPGNPGSLDWKDRSKQICAQIKARGYEPYDFGCLQNPDAMNRESFSWRGYTKMVCNRLSTIYDSSVPELCGCPPADWCGWRQ